MAYIDSQMAQRYNRSPHPDNRETPQPTIPESSGVNPTSGKPEPVPASLGKLHEIDLGQEAKLRNIARTEAATRRLAGDEDEVASGEGHAPTKPAGPNDKQWRHRKRRTSADIERDRLVEEVLRESKRTWPGTRPWMPNTNSARQWMSTMSPTTMHRWTTKPPTTGSPSSSDETSSTPSSPGGSHEKLIPRRRRTRLRCPRGPSWEVVAVREQRCERCRPNRVRNKGVCMCEMVVLVVIHHVP